MSEMATPPDHLPAENGVHVWRAAIIMPPITAIFVGLRFYSRQYVLRMRMSPDDYVVIVTMGLLIGHAVLMVFATYHGMGLHIWQYTPELNADYYLWLGISSMFYTTSLVGFKTALLLLYLQVFGNNKRFRWACWITMGFTWAYLTPALLTEFLGCQPVEKKWLPETPGHCMHDVPAKIFYGAGHVISDLVIGILPLTMIWKLQHMSAVQKIGLSLVLCSGFIAMAFGITRWAISTYNMVSYDRPWWAGISFTLSILEPNMGLICACVATFSPLVQLSYTLHKQWTTRGEQSTSGKAYREHSEGGNMTTTGLTTRNGYDTDTVVLSANAFPMIDNDLAPCDLHGLQALEYGRTKNHRSNTAYRREAVVDPVTSSTNAANWHPWHPERPKLVQSDSWNSAKYQSMTSLRRKPVGEGSRNPAHSTISLNEPVYYSAWDVESPQQRPESKAYTRGYYTEYQSPSNREMAWTENPIYDYSEPTAPVSGHTTRSSDVTTGYPQESNSSNVANHNPQETNYLQSVSYPQMTYFPGMVDYTEQTTGSRHDPSYYHEGSEQPISWVNFSHPLSLRRDRTREG